MGRYFILRLSMKEDIIITVHVNKSICKYSCLVSLTEVMFIVFKCVANDDN